MNTKWFFFSGVINTPNIWGGNNLQYLSGTIGTDGRMFPLHATEHSIVDTFKEKFDLSSDAVFTMINFKEITEEEFNELSMKPDKVTNNIIIK